MAVILPGASALYLALKHQDFPMPKECGDVRIEMPVDGVFHIVYTCNLDGEDLAKVGRAFQEIGQSVMNVSKTYNLGSDFGLSEYRKDNPHATFAWTDDQIKYHVLNHGRTLQDFVEMGVIKPYGV